MDPAATYAKVIEKGAPLAERAEAAVNMLVWLAKGGETHPPGERAGVIEACEAVLIAYHEDVELRATPGWNAVDA